MTTLRDESHFFYYYNISIDNCCQFEIKDLNYITLILKSSGHAT